MSPSRRRPRLLVVSQPPIAGVPRHVLDLLARLDLDRWDVTVACPPGTELWDGLDAFPGVERVALPMRRQPAAGDVVALARLVRLVRRADVVHAHSSKAGFLARLACLLTGRTARCVFTPHGWSFWAFEGVAGRLFTVLERAAARWCRTIIAVSAYEREAGLARRVGTAERYEVILNGVDVDRFARPRREDPASIVMVARLADQKRPVLAVDAMAALRDLGGAAHLKAVHLKIAGDGPLRAEVEARIAQHGLGDRVTLLGERDDVPDLLAHAAVALQTSLYEGCPLTVLEAMAAGVPVVAVGVGGIDELVDEGETGFVTTGDPHDIAKALLRVLDDAELRTRMGRRAAARARAEFTRERMATETFRVYDAILAGDRRIDLTNTVRGDAAKPTTLSGR